MDLNDMSKNPEQIKQLISLLQQLLPQESDNQADESDSKSETQDSGYSDVMRTKGQKSRKNQHNNKFLSMREKDMHKEDTKVDKLLCKNNPVSRSREFSLVKVTCRVCGKTEEINPVLLFDSPNRYKCNNCSTTSG